MQIVDDKARDVTNSPSSGPHDADNDDKQQEAESGADPSGGDEDGSIGLSGSQISYRSNPRSHVPNVKFDHKKIDTYMGVCKIASREDCTKRAAPWVRRMSNTLLAQNVPPESHVRCGSTAG